MHGPGRSSGATYRLPDQRPFSDDFHLYSVTWTDRSIAFAVDNIEYERQTLADMGADKWVYDHPFFLVLDLAVGGKWPGSPVDAHTAFPQEMVVDYVRVYSLDPAGATLPPSPTP